MTATRTAAAVLDENFLEARAKLLELAAIFDRIDRADASGQLTADPRVAQLRRGIEILGSVNSNRAERIQMLFSDPYDPAWNQSGTTK